MRRQDIGRQVNRLRAETVELRKVRIGERRVMAIPVSHYLTLAAILFTIGVFGIFLNRKNVIIILMSIELILLAVNINFVAFSAYLGDLAGQIFAMFILTVAAGRGGDRARDRRGLLPQSRQHRGRRHQPDAGLRRGHAADHPGLLARAGRPRSPACSAA